MCQLINAAASDITYLVLTLHRYLPGQSRRLYPFAGTYLKRVHNGYLRDSMIQWILQVNQQYFDGWLALVGCFWVCVGANTPHMHVDVDVDVDGGCRYHMYAQPLGQPMLYTSSIDSPMESRIFYEFLRIKLHIYKVGCAPMQNHWYLSRLHLRPGFHLRRF